MPRLTRRSIVPDRIERRFLRRIFGRLFGRARTPGAAEQHLSLRRERQRWACVRSAHRRRLLLAVLVLIHLAVAVFLPVRWSSIRGQFQDRLREKLTAELNAVFLPVPDDIAAAVRDEKRQAEALVTETKQIADWLSEREQASHVGDLYGK